MESLELNVAETPKPELQELPAGPAVQVSIAILVWECGASDGTWQRVHERFVEVQSADDLRHLAESIDSMTNRRNVALATA